MKKIEFLGEIEFDELTVSYCQRKDGSRFFTIDINHGPDSWAYSDLSLEDAIKLKAWLEDCFRTGETR